MTLDVYADLDDVTVNLDAAIRAAADAAREDATQWVCRWRRYGRLCGHRRSDAAGWLRAGCSATICQL